MLEGLKNAVYEANMELYKTGLVIFTWGNVSGIDHERRLVVIKPSGVSYDQMKPEDMVVLDLEGNVVEGKMKPSSDTPTHLVLYKAFEELGGIVHTHSKCATSFAQAGMDIPALGTTHADYFFGNVPCTRELTRDEIVEDYETNTGKVIVETFMDKNLMAVPGALVHSHGPFTWGSTPADAIYYAVVLEQIAEIAYKTLTLNPNVEGVPQFLLDKHFYRKHGPDAYYGQND